MLTGQAKKDYQREYQRKHQKEYRLRCKGSNQESVKTLLEVQGLILEGNRIVGATKQVILPSEGVRVPLYDPSVHKSGDRVLVRRGNKLIEIVIPELDAGGQPVPDYT